MSATACNFTKAVIAGFPLPAKDANGRSTRVTYCDSKIQGLRLRITSSGTRTFSVYRWFKGTAKPERVTLGRFPELSVEQARNKAHQVLAAMAEGRNPNELVRKKKSEISFGQLFDFYLDRHAKPNNRTWQQNVSVFRLYLTNNNRGICLSTKQISAIDRNQIALLHSKIGMTHRTAANRVLALVRSVFGRAIEWGLFDKPNPATLIRAFPEQSRDRFLQADELPRFFAAIARGAERQTHIVLLHRQR